MEIKVMVVDDEERQRRSIVRHVDWERYRMQVVGEAEDAAEALELAGRAAPDLLITDIRLLGASGLELAARMREINPRLRIILVTGYEEFEYAKSALDIGVDAFLVKPIMFDELKALLASICQADAAERTRSREERQLKEQLSAFKPVAQEQFFQELIQGLVVGEETIRLRADAFGLFAREGLRRVLIAVIDADPDAALPKEEQIRRARGLLGEAAAAVCGALLEERTTTQRGSLVLILSERETGGFDRDTEACIERLRLEAEKIEGCTVSIGIGPPVPALNQLSRSFRLAQHAVNQRLLGGGERTYSWKTLIQPEDRPDKSIEALVGDFFEVLGAGDSQNSLNLLGEILSGIAGNLEVQGAKLRSLCLQLVTGAYRTAAEIGDAARQLGPESALWERILECGEETEQLQETVDILNGICAFIAERKKSHTQLVVQKALDYMNVHYKESLTLRSVAESVYLSPSYLGALFRTELGASFTDQLIQIRIQKAKEMLQQPHLKLYEVAEGVGYQNIGYFTGVFKRMTGFSPKEYRTFLGFSQSE